MGFNNLALWKKIFLALAGPVILMFVMATVNYRSVNDLLKANEWVGHTHEVIETAQNIEAAAIDMETGMRGYLLTGKQEFLEPYEKGSKEFGFLISTLKLTVDDNRPQVHLLQNIEETIDTWKRKVVDPNIELRAKISSAKSMDSLAKQIAKGQGKKFFDKFRRQIKSFIDHEKNLLLKRSKLTQDDRKKEILALNELMKNFEDLTHTHEALYQAANLMQSAADMETGMRGFLISGKEEFLDPYQDGKANFPKTIKELKKTVTDTPAQLALLNEIERNINTWQLKVTEPSILLRREIVKGNKKMDELVHLVSQAKGKAFFDKFRDQIANFMAVEKVFLLKKIDEKAKAKKTILSQVQSIEKSEMWVKHTYDVIHMALVLQRAAMDMETGMRGYLLAGETRFLSPYNTGTKVFEQQLVSLKRKVEDNPIQVDLLTDVQENIRDWHSQVTKPMIALRGEINEGLSMHDMADLIGKAEGKQFFDRFRKQIESFIDEEKILLVGRQKELNKSVYKSRRNTILATLLACILVLVIFYLLTRSITQPLQDLGRAAYEIGQGKLDIEVDTTRQDEIGALSLSLKEMRDTILDRDRDIARQSWLISGQNELSDIMREQKVFHDLIQVVLNYIAGYLEMQVGAFFSSDGKKLRLEVSYAYKQRNSNSNEFSLGEGLVGQAALERELIIFRDLSLDQINLSVNSGLGETKPMTVAALPLITGDELVGVLELGTTRALGSKEIAFLEKVAESVAITIKSLKSQVYTKELLKETQRQSTELETQQQELEQTNTALQDQQAELEEQQTMLEIKNEALENTKAELNEKASDLASASKYKSEFLANMSHELRSPLNSLLLFAESLAQNNEGNLTDEQVKFSQSIHNCGKELLELINDVLNLSKVESGKMDVCEEEILLEDIKVYMDDNYRAQIEKKGLSYIVDIKGDLPPALTSDSVKVKQILKNFFSNALKFTSSGDISFVIAAGNEIELKNCEIEDRSDYIVFSVCDSGIGIPQEKMETIFEAFRQADGSTSRNYGGTGLGLSISLELSRLLGGMVHLQSEEGKGSQFSLLLPLKFQKMSPAPIVEKTYTINPNSKTVLIIEDDELFAGICADLAEKKGFKAIVASSGERGLDLAKEHLPSAIILDIKLPKMDGYSVLEKLQETKEIAGIPVHVISGVNDETRAIQLGAVEFLKKPVSTASLQSIFHSIENATGDVIEDLLLIMDKSDVYEEVQALLKGTGQKHFHASNEKDALKILEEQAIRCLIIDLDSSSIAPEAFLKAASENKAFKLPPVVVLSEQELSGEQVRSLEKYAEGIIIRNSTVQKNHLDRLSLFIHQVASKKKKSDSKVKATLNNTELLEGKAILLVDDDPRNSYALATRLEQHGMIVHQAFNGQEAIELILKEASIDLTLMDIMMPIMDGYEAMGKIRAKDFPRSKMPIIALTAKAMKEDRDLCLDAGADDYLAKPIDFDKLISLIQVWVQKDEG